MPRLTFFHLFYSTTFTLLSLVTLALVLVPPGDAIAQSLNNKNKQVYNVFAVVGTYVLTALVAVVLYTSRMYAFRRLLADIPKDHAPIGKAELPSRVHAAVTSGISRSANIAFISRPDRERDGAAMWGIINHPGWAPPGGELQGVEYRSIVSELPVLLEREAGAVVAALGGLDAGVVARRPQMTLRQWLENLVGMELAPRDATEGFLATYERARFRMRGKGIEEAEFRGLMKALKALLTGMGAVSSRYEQDPGAWQYAMGSSDGGGGGGASWDGDRGGDAAEYPSSVVHAEPTAEYPGFGDAFAAFNPHPHSSADYGYGYSYDDDDDDDDDGYTPDPIDSRASSEIAVGVASAAAASGTLITPPRRRRPDSGSSGRSSFLRPGGGGNGDGIARRGRRRLSLRASTGTFG